MNTTFQVDSTSSALFLLSSGGYITVVAIIVSVMISLVAFRKRIMAVAYIFLGIAAILISTIFLYRGLITCAPFWTLTQVVRHVGQLCRIAPFLVVLWIVIKAEKPEKRLANEGLELTFLPGRQKRSSPVTLGQRGEAKTGFSLREARATINSHDYT